MVQHRMWPHIETFVKDKVDNFQKVKLRYKYGSAPKLLLKKDKQTDTIRIDNWKTEQIEDFLKDKLVQAYLS